MGSNVLYGNVAEDDFGVYFWEHECVDTVQMHGYFYIVNGERVDYTCSELKSRCGREPVIDQYCPQTCGTCDKARESWTHPSLPRTIHFTPGSSTENCQSELTLNGVTKSMAEFLQEFEDQKSQACASTLFHMKHQTPAFHELFDLYFGDFTDVKFDDLLGVITRICTVDDYTYNCDPGMLDSQSNSCSFRMSDWEKDRIVKLGANEFETDFPSGRYVRQHDLVQNGFQQHIIDCFNDPDIRCGYTSVLAYVKHQWVGNRNINLCPVSFWAQAAKPYGGLLQILHELSHFKDLAEAGHHYFSNREEMAGNIYSTHAISLFMAGITDLQTMSAVNTWWSTTWDNFDIQMSNPTSSPSKQMPFTQCSDQRAEFKWEPMDNIAGETASMEVSEADCATRCEFTDGCIGTTFESDGTCHLSREGAKLVEITGEVAECTNESDAEEYCMQYYSAYMRYCDRYTRYCSSWSFVKDCCRASCNNCKTTPANSGIIGRQCAAVPSPTMAPTFKDSLCGTIQVRGSTEPHKQLWSLGDYSYKCRGPSGTPYVEGFNNPQECCLPQREHELVCSGNDGWKGGYIILTKANGDSREYCRDFTSGIQQKTIVTFP